MEKKNQMVIACPKCGKPVATLNRNAATENVFRAAEQHHCDGKHADDENGAATCVTIEVSPVMAETKADRRLNALRKAGIDVSGYTALNGILIRIGTTGAPEVVGDNDPVFDGILIDGTVPARELFMRWIPAQMLAALDYKPYRGEGGFTPWLKAKGYEYSLKVTLHWLQFISQCIKHGDGYNAGVVGARFSVEVVSAILAYDLAEIEKYIADLRVKHCKGREYKAVKGYGKGVFLDEIDSKVLKPLRRAIAKFEAAKTPSARVNAFAAYLKARKVKFRWDNAASVDFVDAFKAVGAFYTMRDLILFEGAKCWTEHYNPRTRSNEIVFLDKDASLTHIEGLVKDADFNGYKMLGMLKEFLERNGIDVADKREEWHRRSEARRALK